MLIITSMNLIDELNQQPKALRDLVTTYFEGEKIPIFERLPEASSLLFTGMGASFHAGSIAALHMAKAGIDAQAIESADLLNYILPATLPGKAVIYISQSGASGEVNPILDRLNPHLPLVSLTNNLQSSLALQSQLVLPMVAGNEAWIASKTYLNSLAVVWLMARTLGGRLDGSERASLLEVADHVESILDGAKEVQARFLETFKVSPSLLFLGHGPHAITARESAMTMSEWAKLPALHSGIGAYRHGFIESIHPGQGVVVFAAPGMTHTSSLAVANELASYEAKVLVVENGRAVSPGERAQVDETFDEFLSPLLDILPVQLYSEALARELGIEPGFRHIHKVVTDL